jgi:hypothetical protein
MLRTITVSLCQAIVEESDGDDEFADCTNQAEKVNSSVLPVAFLRKI